jgi:chromatin assembly factor 1 subunit B
MVRFSTPQITWHGGEGGKNAPVLSLDFHPSDRHLIVSGGADAEARVWLVDGESADHTPRYLYTLTGHELSINCVRWSPDGNSVAAGADGGMLISWTLPARYVLLFCAVGRSVGR